MFKELDIESWERRSTFEFFRYFEDPFFNIAASVDVTRLRSFCKANDLAFSLSGLFYSLQAANNIREFRFRMIEESILEFEAVHATQTILNDDETFSFAYFENKNSVFEFVEAGIEAREKYKALKSFDVESDRVDLIYYSVIPWVSFTSFKHANRLNRGAAIPRIVFGKTFDDGRGLKMPVSVEAHHALMDGIHVGKFFNDFQTRLDEL
ncbi:MAG: CatA-like O-acetyltransferase [Blastocatellia bacterium]